ncbi:MAG: cyclophilin-like fold protein [Flammeovirgaceae bacterium]
MKASKIKILVNGHIFKATLLDNKTANAFKEMLPLMINMIELNGNEKYYDLPKNLPTNSFNPRAIKNGDLMLYGSRTLVLFYKNFSTPYGYTKLGEVEEASGLAAALTAGDTQVSFELE